MDLQALSERCVHKDKKFKFIPAILAGFFILFFALSIPLPTPQTPYRLYSTDRGDDLKEVLKKAILKSSKSITLHSFAITDLSILTLLKEKAQKGVEVHLVYHKKTTPPLHDLNFKNLYFHPIDERGLMHEKIWIFDQSMIFLGSTNLTPSSLKMHHNSMVGLYSPSFAKKLLETRSEMIETAIGKMSLSYFPLPYSCGLEGVLHALSQAKKKVKVSLFTFTHPQIVEKLIELSEKGVNVEVHLDGTTALGASRAAKEKLEKSHIKVKKSSGRELHHHKWAEIDQKILIIGSANWTKSAFKKNRDFILILNK